LPQAGGIQTAALCLLALLFEKFAAEVEANQPFDRNFWPTRL